MTLNEFDKLQTGDTVYFHSLLHGRKIKGTAHRLDDETVRLDWEDKQTVTFRRHEVRIHAHLFGRFTVD